MAMGTVTRLATASESMTLGRAVTAYLATLAGDEQRGTKLVYGRVLRRAEREFSSGTALAGIGAEAFAEWFTGQWAGRAPATWNGALDAIRAAARYWADQGWITTDPSRLLRRRRPRPDRSRALSRAEADDLLTREDISLRERTLWRLLYETAARSAEVLAWTWKTWICRTAGHASAARAVPPTGSSGRPAQPGCCRAC
jgi:integrase